MVDRSHVLRATRTNRSRTIILASSMILILSVIVVVVLPPIKQLRTDAKQLNSRTSTMNALIASTSTGSASVARPVPPNVFKQIDSSTVIKLVYDSAAAVDCRIASMQPVQSEDPLEVSSWVLSVAGNYNCFGNLIDLLEQSPMIVQLGSVSLAGRRGASVIDASLNFRIWDPQ